jgi:hypothetical protein
VSRSPANRPWRKRLEKLLKVATGLGLRSATREESARLDVAADALQQLDNHQLAEVLFHELYLRDVQGSGTPGLYNGATTAIQALLGLLPKEIVFAPPPANLPANIKWPRVLSSKQELAAEQRQREMATNIALLGEGFKPGHGWKDKASKLRWLRERTEMIHSEVSDAAWPASLARTLSHRFERDVESSLVAKALSEQTQHARLARLAVAVGMYPTFDAAKNDVKKLDKPKKVTSRKKG